MSCRRKRGYRSFYRWAGPAGEIYNLNDSWHDMPKDYAQGKIALAPNHLTRLYLAAHVPLAVLNGLLGANRAHPSGLKF